MKLEKVTNLIGKTYYKNDLGFYHGFFNNRNGWIGYYYQNQCKGFGLNLIII